MKKISISILGSTGSIGLNTFEIIKKRKNIFKIILLSANKNYSEICKQIRRYNPEVFVINNNKILKKVKKKFKNKKIKIVNNFEVLRSFKKTDVTISAIPGIAGLKPTILMTQKSKKVLIANKESIICGWRLIKNKAKRFNTKLIPIDSEHFSIMQLLKSQRRDDIEKIYITASGGPFLNRELNKFKKIKPHDAIKHPKWKMGKKVSIDSATLMNKILEIIEAQKLFCFDSKKFEILIHPESLVHAIIKFKNGLSKFIYHETSMIVPLANAIFNNKINIDQFYKTSKKNKNLYKNLSFKKIDIKKFPLSRLKDKINDRPSSAIIINAANEILVDQFLKKNINFLDINKFILSTLRDRNFRKYAIREPKNIDQIYKIDNWARTLILKKIEKKNDKNF